MYDYIIGKIVEIKTNGIVLENNGIGYFVNVANPFMYDENTTSKVYIYQQIKEDDNSLFGFATSRDKDLFLKLINVKGLGCKMALPILAASSHEMLVDAIETENITYLKKFPKIGEKLAKQIVLDLKGKLDYYNLFNTNVVSSKENTELKEVLIGLGYKEKEIKGILNKVDNKLSIEEQIKEALKLLLK